MTNLCFTAALRACVRATSVMRKVRFRIHSRERGARPPGSAAVVFSLRVFTFNTSFINGFGPRVIQFNSTRFGWSLPSNRGRALRFNPFVCQVSVPFVRTLLLLLLLDWPRWPPRPRRRAGPRARALALAKVLFSLSLIKHHTFDFICVCFNELFIRLAPKRGQAGKEFD